MCVRKNQVLGSVIKTTWCSASTWLWSLMTTSKIPNVLWSETVTAVVRVSEQGFKATQMLRFPHTPEFHVYDKSTQSKTNVKTLQMNPESDRSSLSCPWYHFPSFQMVWMRSDNCHHDLAPLYHSLKSGSGGVGQYYQHSQSPVAIVKM